MTPASPDPITPSYPIKTQLAVSRAGLGALYRQLGIAGTFRAIAGMAALKIRNNPLRCLPAPADIAEKCSRTQAEPAVLMYAPLKRRLGEHKALEIIEKVALRAAAVFLEATVDFSGVEQQQEMDEEQRLAHITRISDRFFNAVAEPRLEEDGFSLTVSACHFARLTAAIGMPELAPVFCAADLEFFNKPSSPVRLTRTTTLATGGSCCDFRFTFHDQHS